MYFTDCKNAELKLPCKWFMLWTFNEVHGGILSVKSNLYWEDLAIVVAFDNFQVCSKAKKR